MTRVIGWDIGGANTKAVFLRTENGQVRDYKGLIEYFPVWKNPEKLVEVLLTLKEKVSGNTPLDCVGLTMTAELSDAYQTKRAGVNHILACAAQAFEGIRVFVLDVNASLLSMDAFTSKTKTHMPSNA